MNVLKIIRDADLGFENPPPETYEERGASRAIVFDENGDVALLHAIVKGYHKLPGGGIEKGEDLEAALRREVLEEIGCEITNIRELGIIEEYRNELALHQTSYCFIADLSGAKGTPHLEADEAADGFETVWMNLDDAIATAESETNIKHYEGKFIQTRDLAFLKAAKDT